jgi:hypothetical protein
MKQEARKGPVSWDEAVAYLAAPGKPTPVGVARPGRRRRARWPLACLAVILSVLAIDGFIVEPNWIEVGRSVEYLPGLRAGASDFTLVHLSDLHIARLGFRERRAIDIVNAARPDVIVVTGDLTASGGSPQALTGFLAALHARDGKFAVWGNHDYWDGSATTWGPEAVRRGGFTILDNANQRVAFPGGRVVVAGIDDPVTGRDNLKKAMQSVSRRDVCLLLAHSPEVVRSLGNWDIDLVLAGHTHGGQLRFPWIGALWIPYGTRDYLDGWYDVGGGARLHVNRGLGWSWIPVRFLCRPRIDRITLRGGVSPGARRNASVVGRS